MFSVIISDSTGLSRKRAWRMSLEQENETKIFKSHNMNELWCNVPLSPVPWNSVKATAITGDQLNSQRHHYGGETCGPEWNIAALLTKSHVYYYVYI